MHAIDNIPLTDKPLDNRSQGFHQHTAGTVQFYRCLQSKRSEILLCNRQKWAKNQWLTMMFYLVKNMSQLVSVLLVMNEVNRVVKNV